MPYPPIRPDDEYVWSLPAKNTSNAGSLGNSVDATKSATPSAVYSIGSLKDGVSVAKSLLMIDSVDSDPNSVTIAVKQTTLSTTSNYYAFGTTLFFKPNNVLAVKESSGGLAFFSNANGTSCYIINLKSSGLAGLQSSDEFQILKIKYNEDTKKTTIVRIPDSQDVSKKGTKFVGVNQGQAYKIDVNVKIESGKTYITAFINGTQIKAVDADGIIPKSNNIGLFASLGEVGFDYVYAKSITLSEYNSSLTQELYKTQFAQISSSLLYGDLWLSGINKIQQSDPNVWIEEFGPVAREIKYVDKDFQYVPSSPSYAVTGLNQFVDIVAYNVTPFNIKAYIINNSGMFIPMTTEFYTKLNLIGVNIINSAGLIYMDESLNKYDTQEPITFDSKWIQKETDAKSLSDWIKTQWKNQQMSLDIQCIVNPKIEIGDIISINYNYHGLNGTEKFIVNSINQTWNGGLTTSIKARSIYA